MMVRAEITADGTVKVKNPQSWYGKEVQLIMNDSTSEETHAPNGMAILQAFQYADTLNITRKSHDELLQELHEVRE